MGDWIALTVDLEPDWGVRGTRALREITPVFLRFLEERGIAATFFIVSDLLETSSGLVAAIAERNEVGSHGCSHRLLGSLCDGEARRELKESRQRLEDVAGAVRGFRAPFFQRRPAFFRMLRKAGYSYDASLGSVLPGPVNGRLARLGCPFRRGDLYEFPTAAMWGGMMPLSLTWLRILAPASLAQLPGSASLLYLHLHEFLSAETAACLPARTRWLLTRNCGRTAWRILDEALEALGGRFTTCGSILDATRDDSA